MAQIHNNHLPTSLEEVFEAFISKSAYGFLDVDKNGIVRSANARIAAILCYDQDELRGKHYLEFVAPQDHERIKESFESKFELAPKPPRHYVALKKNGELCHLEISSMPVAKSGEFAGFHTAVLDITERKKAEEALKKSEGMLRNLIEHMPDFLAVIDRNARIQYVNRDFHGITSEELLGKNGFDFVHPDSLEEFRESLRKAFDALAAVHVEAQSKMGTWWSCQLVPVLEDGRADTVMVICTDVTPRREADEKIRREQELLRKLLELHERERALVAFEIHDGFSQQLTGALLNLEASRQLAKSDGEKAAQSFEKGLTLLRESIEEARRLVAGLRPPVLEEFGIIPAIEQLVAENNDGGGPHIEFASNIRPQRLAPPLENAVFRMVQETLANARRHSKSKKVRLEIFQDGKCVHLAVQDWGIGFDPEKVAEDRFGLKGIRERARLLGGNADIETTEGKGTRIIIKLPKVL